MRTHWIAGAVALLAAGGLVFLAGCKKSDDTPPDEFTVSDLSGAWLSGCRQEYDAVFDGTESRLTAVSITAAGAIRFQEYHWSWNWDCDGNPTLMFENIGTLTFVGAEVTTSYGAAVKADLTATEQWLTIFDSDVAGTFDAAGAYGLSWSQGVRQEITGKDYSGGDQGTTMQTLLRLSGSTLFVGDDSTVDESGYPTEVTPEVMRLPAIQVTAAGLEGEWGGTCRYDYHSGYLTQVVAEYLTFSGTTVAVTTTYLDSPYSTTCDTNTATPMVREVMTMTLSMGTGATLLTEQGMATPADVVLTGREVTPLSASAVTTMNAANDPDGPGGPALPVGAWGYTDWALDTPKSLPLDRRFDGSGGGETAMKIAAVLRGDRLYVRSAETAATMPLDAAGYPLSVGVTPLLRNRPITVADMAGNWFDPCTNPEVWATLAHTVSAGSMTRNEWWYSGAPTCEGLPTGSYSVTYTVAVGGSTPTVAGTAYYVDLDDSGNHVCALAMRLGNRLYGFSTWWGSTTPSPCVVPDDYPPSVGDAFASLETSPVTTAPLSTWRGPCRQETGSPDWVDYFTFLGNAMVGRTQKSLEGSGCSGVLGMPEGFAGLVSFGGLLAPAPAEGDATRVVVTDPTAPAGEQQMMQLFKWMDEVFWFGDDLGPVDDDGYPTQLIPGHGMTRIY